MINLKELEDDVKKLLGKPPYNHPSNICWNDNYYSKSLENKYGEIAVNAEIKRQNDLGIDRIPLRAPWE